MESWQNLTDDDIVEQDFVITCYIRLSLRREQSSNNLVSRDTRKTVFGSRIASNTPCPIFTVQEVNKHRSDLRT